MAEYKHDYEIAALLAKALTGTLSEEEESVLEEWRAGHSELYENILKSEHKKERDDLIEGIQVEVAWEKVKKDAGLLQPRKRRLYQPWRVAASILLCIGVGGLLFWFGNSIQQPEVVEFAGIETGSSKALLITSEGQQIVLEDSTVRQIMLPGGMVATNDGKKVVYAKPDSTTGKNEEVKYNTVKVPRGGEYELLLSDYTRVRLNSATELRFPVQFGKNRREVYLEGEAFFSVTKDEKRPFVVKVGKQLSVEVLGTEFNVMAYSEEDRIETTLNRGKVRVSDIHMTVELSPNEQAVYDKSQHHLRTQAVDAEKYSAWKDGKFIFENASLENILIRLGRWYNIHVFYQNPEAKNFHFTGDLERYEHFDQTLKMLEKATNVRFQINKDNVIVRTVN